MSGFFGGWRGLGRFWGLFLLAVVAVGAGLEFTAQTGGAIPEPPEVGHDRPTAPVVLPQVMRPAPMSANHPGRDAPGPVEDPDPALLEPRPGSAAEVLPRVAADGTAPMRRYAAGFDPTSVRPRVGLLIAGIGLNVAESRKAIAELPGGVSLAVSHYAINPEPLLSSARLAGHEYLISLPMEPLQFPLSDPGPNAMMTTLSAQENHKRLLWALVRIRGYVGATAALGTLFGERFADMPDLMEPVFGELGRRGLVYVAAPGQSSPVPHAWSRAIEIVIDEPAVSDSIDSRLSALETIARDRGSALGLAVAPRPVTVDRIGIWASNIANHGLALAPVSALMLPPEDKPK